MKIEEKSGLRPWQNYYGPNMGYIYEQYERYTEDPESVDPTFKEMFANWGAPPSVTDESIPLNERQAAQEGTIDIGMLKKVVAAEKLVWNIRTYGHLAADLDPLKLRPKADTRLIQTETYELNKEDLMAMPASLLWENAPVNVATGWDAIGLLRQLYTKSTAYEFSHVHEEHERDWLNKRVESEALASENLTPQERTSLLDRLIQVEQFENFLHRTFVGQKRFSVEGTDALIPMLDEIVRFAAKDGAKHVLMGMAHRGRLNVLAHVLGKPYGKIFSEFHHSPNKDLVPSEGSTGISHGWSGDVKYHLGADRALQEGEIPPIRLTLANNPSHLEYVNPVVEGFARAAQEDRGQPGYPEQDVSKAVAVLIHGDAAFAGEGIVAETLNFNQLKGYRNGGTLHIIANNRLGFTTESKDSRSTYYASDLAKGYEIPIVHVNADDPEACIKAIRIACEYRARFKKDFLIDLVGYRRYGHNESDDPETTQPITYATVKTHPTVSTVYAEKLAGEGVVSEEQAAQMRDGFGEQLKMAYDEVKAKDDKNGSAMEIAVSGSRAALVTGVPLNQLKEINSGLLQWPEGFHVYPKLKRILERRAKALDEGEKVDWALAETLAFATLLADGKPIRLSGQDSERGTFAHRHLVLHDTETGEIFVPLHGLAQARASFAVHNSPLSEASVLGFEYGYNVFAPETLVLWEAQFGDFANAGQVIIDQFIAAGHDKWRQRSSLVLLLPHGYEGQGPEHSSARLERFLQLGGDENWTVANLTSAAQYFHLLRKQAMLSESEEARPLIVMSPKSLIRNARVASPGSNFSGGGFSPVLEQRGLGSQPERVERVLLCSGKVALDLEEALESDKNEIRTWLHILRVEQLYPFPKSEIAEIIRRFPNLKELVWVQEEPKNMGAWSFMEPRIHEIAPEQAKVRYIGRPDRSSPASGYQHVHSSEQQRLISLALNHSVDEN